MTACWRARLSRINALLSRDRKGADFCARNQLHDHGSPPKFPRPMNSDASRCQSSAVNPCYACCVDTLYDLDPGPACPERVRMIVDLPAPLAPSMVTISFDPIRKETPFSARMAP